MSSDESRRHERQAKVNDDIGDWLLLLMFVGVLVSAAIGIGAEPSTPLEASVKVVVQSGKTRYLGAGTMIDGTQGRSLIATCAHTWDGVAADATTSVEHAGLTYPARLVGRDRSTDVAVLAISSRKALPFVRLANIVPSIGDNTRACGSDSNGRLVCRDERITAVDRYDGGPNLEFTGRAGEGDSGGGLFNAAGQLVGIIQGRRNDLRVSIAGRVSSLETLLAKPAEVQFASFPASEPKEKPPPVEVTVWMAPFACQPCERMKNDCGSGNESIRITYKTGPPPWLARYEGEHLYPLYEWNRGKWSAQSGYRDLAQLQRLIDAN